MYSTRLNSRSMRLIKLLPAPITNPSEIHLELIDFAIASAPAYLALSYTWGLSSANVGNVDRDYVFIGGIPWAVSANLFSALVHLREAFTSAYLWIDALCINQDNVIERQAQVPIMDKIYRRADQVIIWLGPATDTSEEVLRLVRQVANLGSNVIEQFGSDLHADCLCHHQLPHPTADIWHRYLEFYDQRWFHRSWIIQEAVLAQPGRSIVHWGPWTLPWSEVLAGSQIFLPDRLRKAIFSRTDPHTLHSSPVGRNALRIGLIAAACDPDAQIHTPIVDLSTGLRGLHSAEHILLHLMRMARDFHCTDPRDRVYSLLGLVNYVCERKGLAPSHIKANYSPKCTLAMVLTLVATSIITSTNYLGIISHVSDLAYRKTKNLPGWVPDFILSPNYAMGRDAVFDASNFHSFGQRGFSISGNSLFVHATRLGKIRHSSPASCAGPASDLIAILKLVAGTSLDSSSDPVEVLWRTMIWDVYGHGHTADEHPAPASLEDAFLTSLMPILQDGPAEHVTEAKAIISSLLQQHFSSSRPLATTQKLHQVICYASTRTDHEWYKEHNGADDATPEADKYSSYASGVTWSQRLFALDNGLLAMGPQSGVAGDEAWIISGCPFPMILRPSGPQDEYKVLGRSYIHGFMHGKGAPDDDHAWRWVCLV